jgi:glc operon protein GlcG
MVIAVADAGGHLLALVRMDGTQFGSIAVAQAKALSAVAFKRPTRIFEEGLASTTRILAVSQAMPIAGGLPLTLDGKLVGAIAVSGGTPDEDEMIASAGARALGRD